METSDLHLLRSYVHHADEFAFAQLVDRHGDWIFAAARRRLRDDHLAEDATQAVFIVLATKAPQLVQNLTGPLSAWLFHVMHFTCARIWRTGRGLSQHPYQRVFFFHLSTKPLFRLLNNEAPP